MPGNIDRSAHPVRHAPPSGLTNYHVFRYITPSTAGPPLASQGARHARKPETTPLHTAAAPRPSRITPADIRQIAFTLVDRHGARALGYACEAIAEMEDKGEAESAAAWRALKSEIEDALTGRIHAASPLHLH